MREIVPIIAALISAPISANVFGGVTGGGTDFLVLAFRQAGADIGAATLGQGLISDLGNPKMAVFFASILPQFAHPGEGMFSGLVLLGLVFSGLTFSWLAFYAVMLAKLGHFLQRPAIRRPFEAVMGGLLVALGVRLAAEQRA